MTRKPIRNILIACFVLLITLIGLEAAVHHRIGEALADYVLHQPRFAQ